MASIYTTAGVDKGFFSAADLATSVATNLGKAVFSVVTSFWGGGGGRVDDKQGKGDAGKAKPPAAALEPCTELPLALSLNDPRRRVLSVVLAPSGQHAVTTDTYGRVLLLKARDMTVLRVWKGYREAECCWLQSLEDIDPAGDVAPGVATPRAKRFPDRRRSCSFLVIFAPRRGLLEVWNIPLGPRVAAFNLGPGSKLVPAGPLTVTSAARRQDARQPRCTLVQWTVTGVGKWMRGKGSAGCVWGEESLLAQLPFSLINTLPPLFFLSFSKQVHL